jgi:uncharacterized protein
MQATSRNDSAAPLNHLFQSAPSGAESEYVEIEETLAPTALTRVNDWILTAVK